MFSWEMRCSDYFSCLSFCFKSCLDRKLQAMCLDLFSSRLQNQRTGLPLVQLLEVSHGWAKEYSSSLFGFFLLFFCPSFPSASHVSLEGFLDFPLELCLRDGMTVRLKGKGSSGLQEFWNLWAVGVSRWCCYLICPQTNFRKIRLIMR